MKKTYKSYHLWFKLVSLLLVNAFLTTDFVSAAGGDLRWVTQQKNPVSHLAPSVAMQQGSVQDLMVLVPTLAEAYSLYVEKIQATAVQDIGYVQENLVSLLRGKLGDPSRHFIFIENAILTRLPDGRYLAVYAKNKSPKFVDTSVPQFEIQSSTANLVYSVVSKERVAQAMGFKAADIAPTATASVAEPSATAVDAAAATGVAAERAAARRQAAVAAGIVAAVALAGVGLGVFGWMFAPLLKAFAMTAVAGGGVSGTFVALFASVSGVLGLIFWLIP
ncbi:MAG: hypothetical protein NC924_06375, partial [Candidatus Omnitrophica bacterium]|nr:hypothetical protein [Candidatus Omnitrophota bacterium]